MDAPVMHTQSCGTGGAGVLVHLILNEPVCDTCRRTFIAQMEATR